MYFCNQRLHITELKDCEQREQSLHQRRRSYSPHNKSLAWFDTYDRNSRSQTLSETAGWLQLDKIPTQEQPPLESRILEVLFFCFHCSFNGSFVGSFFELMYTRQRNILASRPRRLLRRQRLSRRTTNFRCGLLRWWRLCSRCSQSFNADCLIFDWKRRCLFVVLTT